MASLNSGPYFFLMSKGAPFPRFSSHEQPKRLELPIDWSESDPRVFINQLVRFFVDQWEQVNRPLKYPGGTNLDVYVAIDTKESPGAYFFDPTRKAHNMVHMLDWMESRGNDPQRWRQELCQLGRLPEHEQSIDMGRGHVVHPFTLVFERLPGKRVETWSRFLR